MSTAVAPVVNNTTQVSIIEKVMIGGDLSELKPHERVSYYKSVCDSLGLNPLTQPFAYIVLNGKLTLYARKDCTEQLRNIRNVSIKITAREKIGDVYVVTASASLPSGRIDESTGAVALGNLKGDALANAYLKCETKAKRRVTLSICGLGMLDETEADTVADARKVSREEAEGENFTPPVGMPQEEPKTDQSPQAQNIPAPNPGDWIIPFGKKFKGMKLSDVEPWELHGYCEWIESDSKKSGKPVSQMGQEFLDKVTEYLQAINWQPDQEMNPDDYDRSA